MKCLKCNCEAEVGPLCAHCAVDQRNALRRDGKDPDQLTNKYANNPNLFLRDMHEAVEYVRSFAISEPDARLWGLAEIIDALASKLSEEGSTNSQEEEKIRKDYEPYKF